MTETDTGSKQPSTVAGETSTKNNTLRKDDLFHLLQNERRRLVLRYLAETDGPAEFPHLRSCLRPLHEPYMRTVFDRELSET